MFGGERKSLSRVAEQASPTAGRCLQVTQSSGILPSTPTGMEALSPSLPAIPSPPLPSPPLLSLHFPGSLPPSLSSSPLPFLPSFLHSLFCYSDHPSPKALYGGCRLLIKSSLTYFALRCRLCYCISSLRYQRTARLTPLGRPPCPKILAPKAGGRCLFLVEEEERGGKVGAEINQPSHSQALQE